MNRIFGLPGSGPVKRYEQREALGWLPRGYIDGLILSNDSTDATNDIAVSAGVCRSTANVIEGAVSTLARDQLDIEIPASIIKQLDVSWAPENYDPAGYSGGGRSGMLSPQSSISNTTWHIYAVGGGDCQDDIMAIDSVTQATVISAIAAAGGFTAYRLVGSVLRVSAALLLFTQNGDFFRLKSPPLDNNDATSTTAASKTISVPLGISVRALLNVVSSITNDATSYIRHPDDTDSAPSLTAAPLSNLRNIAGAATPAQLEIWTNTSAQITLRNTANNVMCLATVGWWHPRGRDA